MRHSENAADTHRRNETIACLGSSTTAARGTYDWIAELAKRPENHRYAFVNLGVGGDLSVNANRRTRRVVDLQPDRVLVLIGTNDILAGVFSNFWRVVRVWKRVPVAPSPEFFAENLQHIAIQLRQETNALVALSSLAPVGEDPHSADPVQSKLNGLFADYSRIARDTATSSGCYYLPLYESFQHQLEGANTSKPFSRFSFASFYRDYLFREAVLGRSFDEISRINGWRFHIDGIHLNTDGGLILADAVQQFLDWAPS